MLSDVNGQELRPGGLAMLLCEIVAIENDQVRLRVMNSDLEVAVGTKLDEVLGLVADSELTAFDAAPATGQQDEKPRLRPISAFE